MIRSIRLLLVLSLPLLAAGCGPADLAEHDYRLSHPIAVESRNAMAVFDRPADDRPLPAYDRERLGRLAAEQVRRGAGTADLVAGFEPGKEAEARDFADELAAALRQAGAEVEVRLASGAGAPKPGEAVVTVPVWTAQAPECGQFTRGLNPDYGNAPNSNWGCAIQRNKALMVQNPADLVRARDPSGRDGNRAADVLGKYGQGLATGSAAEAGGSGSVSSVGQGSK